MKTAFSSKRKGHLARQKTFRQYWCTLVKHHRKNCALLPHASKGLGFCPTYAVTRCPHSTNMVLSEKAMQGAETLTMAGERGSTSVVSVEAIWGAWTSTSTPHLLPPLTAVVSEAAKGKVGTFTTTQQQWHSTHCMSVETTWGARTPTLPSNNEELIPMTWVPMETKWEPTLLPPLVRNDSLPCYIVSG